MKVKELIEKLSGFNEEADVVLTYTACDPCYGCEGMDIGKCNIGYKTESKWVGSKKSGEYVISSDMGIVEIEYTEQI